MSSVTFTIGDWQKVCSAFDLDKPYFLIQKYNRAQNRFNEYSIPIPYVYDEVNPNTPSTTDSDPTQRLDPPMMTLKWESCITPVRWPHHSG